MKAFPFKTSVTGIFTSLLLLFSLPSPGAIIAYELFDYADGPEGNLTYANGLNGGFGWDGAWVLETNNPSRINGTIKNGQLVASGLDVAMYRNINLNLEENKVIYFMVDIANASLSDGSAAIGFQKGTTRNEEVLLVGKGKLTDEVDIDFHNIGARYHQSAMNSVRWRQTRIPMGDFLTRLVMVVDQEDGGVWFYVNPDIDSPEERWDASMYFGYGSGGSDLRPEEWLNVTSLWIKSFPGLGDDRIYDNIVIATTWDDLSAALIPPDVIPEPGVTVFALIGIATFFGLHRRRRQ